MPQQLGCRDAVYLVYRFIAATATVTAMAATPSQPVALIQVLGGINSSGRTRHKCCIHTIYGPLTISSTVRDLSRPEVSTLSLLRLGGHCAHLLREAEDCPTRSTEQQQEDIADEEIALFDGNGNGNNPTDAPLSLFRLLPSLKGIRDRLSDAATCTPAAEAQAEVGHLELFLRRSEAIVTELLSAINQYQHTTASTSTGRKRKRSAAAAAAAAAMAAPTALGPSVSYYASLLSQLSLLEKQPHIIAVDLNEDLSRVTVSCHDRAQRKHEFNIALPSTFPAFASSRRPTLYCDLPLEFDPKWKSGPKEIRIDEDYVVVGNTSTGGYSRAAADSTNMMNMEKTSSYGLVDLYEQYRRALESHQILWDDLDELDRTAWILEPSLPASRATAERRIAIQPGLSLALALDPERPRGPPLSARLVGSSANVADLRKKVAAFLDADGFGGGDGADPAGLAGATTTPFTWDSNRSVRINIEAGLGFVLPSPETTEKADYVAECGICYAHRLPPEEDVDVRRDGNSDADVAGAIPDAVCGNPSCARAYHETCLFEWLHSLPGARVSFDRVFGTCPYCSESLSVRVMRR